MLYSVVKKDILKNKTLKRDGKFIGIPNPFSRWSEYMPLIAERGHSVGILSNTGAGKSRLSRYLYIYYCYKFSIENNYPLKIIFFPLEDSKEKVMRNMICHYMHELYNIYINLQELDSKGKKELPDFVVQKLEEAEQFFKDFEKTVTMVDGIHKPSEIYQYCLSYAKKTGTMQSYKVVEDGEEVIKARYIPNNNIHTIVVIDNLSNIEKETDMDERTSVIHLCKKLVREKLCNKYNFTVVQIIQGTFESEKQNYTRDGETMISKLEPSLANIGEFKVIARSMHTVIGMFHPSRFGIIAYPAITKHNTKAYRLDILGNRFRSLHVLKANDVDFGQKIPIYFDAVTENMSELPELDSQELEDLYRKIQNKNPEKFSKLKEIVYNHEEGVDELPF